MATDSVAPLDPITQALQSRLLGFNTYAGERTLEVSVTELHGVLQMLRDEFGFNYLADIVTVDHYTDAGRFGIGYNITNLDAKLRIRVKCRVEEDQPVLPTVTDLWPSANWLEREAWDMMGIRFDGHPDLRRIYMPEDFRFHPHRKEFPLIGIPGSIQVPEKDGPKGYR